MKHGTAFALLAGLLAGLSTVNAACAAEDTSGKAEAPAGLASAPKEAAGVHAVDDRGYYIFAVAADRRQEFLVIHENMSNNLVAGNGKLSAPAHWSPQFSLYSPATYFDGSSHFGYNLYASYYQGYIDRQLDSNGMVAGIFPRVDVTQLGAGISVFASIGDTLVKNPVRGLQFKVGAGIGPAYSRINGTVPAQFMTTGTAENIHSNGLGLSVNFYYRVTLDGFFLEGNAMVATRTSRYALNDQNALIGYTFPFQL